MQGFEIAGLLTELIFLGIGIYGYLFARGVWPKGNPEFEKRAADFREKNGTWLRLLSLALIAIMGINLVLRIQGFFA